MIELRGIPRLETPRLVLRAPKSGDFETWAACAGSDRARYIGGAIDPQPAGGGLPRPAARSASG